MNSSSAATLDPIAVAKAPTQQRAKVRFDRVLKEAEALLLESGLSGFSIPVLAERLGYTRGSLYSYFPTPYALLNELADRYLAELEKVYFERAEELRGLSWREAIRLEINLAAAFHNRQPVACLLILGGAVTDVSYRAQELSIKRMGDLARGLLAQNGLKLPTTPDVTTLAVDIGSACLRRSYFAHGTITPAYSEAAVEAMTGFLAPYVAQAPVANKAKPKSERRKAS